MIILEFATNCAFSEQALRSQESISISYVDLMISKLDKHASSNRPVDIMKLLNFLIFDITGDLTSDESFGTLETEEYDRWIADIFGMLKFGVICNLLRAHSVPVAKLFDIIPVLRKGRNAHINYTNEKMMRRFQKKTDRKDFMRYVCKKTWTCLILPNREVATS
jgi:hypothetical protein